MTAPRTVYSDRYPVLRIILLVLAVICFVIVALTGFGKTQSDSLGWLGAGLALLTTSFL